MQNIPDTNVITDENGEEIMIFSPFNEKKLKTMKSKVF